MRWDGWCGSRGDSGGARGVSGRGEVWKYWAASPGVSGVQGRRQGSALVSWWGNRQADRGGGTSCGVEVAHTEGLADAVLHAAQPAVGGREEPVWVGPCADELQDDSAVLILDPLAALADERALDVDALETQRGRGNARQAQGVRLQQARCVGAQAVNVNVEPGGLAGLGELGRVEGRDVVAHVGAAVDGGVEVVVLDPALGLWDQLHRHIGAVNEHRDGVAGPECGLVDLRLGTGGPRGREQPSACELGDVSGVQRGGVFQEEENGDSSELTLNRPGCVCGFMSSFSGR